MCHLWDDKGREIASILPYFATSIGGDDNSTLPIGHHRTINCDGVVGVAVPANEKLCTIIDLHDYAIKISAKPLNGDNNTRCAAIRLRDDISYLSIIKRVPRRLRPFYSDCLLAFAKITVTSLSAVEVIVTAISAPLALNSFASLSLSVCILL